MAALLSGGEIISIHVGACGGNLAATHWQLIAKEHHLVTTHHVQRARRGAARERKDGRGNRRSRRGGNRDIEGFYEPVEEDEWESSPPQRNAQNLNVFFQENLQRYVPRAVFADMDPAARYSGIFEPHSPLKHFFRPENFIFGHTGSSGIYAQAVTEGQKEVRRTMDAVAREMEKADCAQGIQITHHLGGGTGSGLTTGIAQALHEEYGSTRLPVSTVTLLPSSVDVGGRHNAVEVYNALLALPDLADASELSMLMDNEALYDICFRLIAVQEPGWRDLNHVIAAMMAGLSACMRFPSISSHYAAATRLHFRDILHLLQPCILGDQGSNRGEHEPMSPISSQHGDGRVEVARHGSSLGMGHSEAARLYQSTAPVPNFVIPGFAPFTNRAANAPLGALLDTAPDDDILWSSDEDDEDGNSDDEVARSGDSKNKNGEQAHHCCFGQKVDRALRSRSRRRSSNTSLRYRRVGTRMPSVAELAQSLFRPSHLLASVDPLGHHYLSALAVFRGQVSPGEVEQEVNYSRLNGPQRYHEWSQWMPRDLHCKICPEPPVNLQLSASWLGATTAIGNLLEQLANLYEKLLMKRAFTHVFTNAGLDLTDFSIKLERVRDMIDAYDGSYANKLEQQVERYEAQRDLGTIPFRWDIKSMPETVFDTHKTVRLQW